jgi:hypothetical protein
VDNRPGTAVRATGTAAAVIGVIVIVISFQGRRYGFLGDDGVFVGALLLVSGLLLRIEAAVAAGRTTGDGR